DKAGGQDDVDGLQHLDRRLGSLGCRVKDHGEPERGTLVADAGGGGHYEGLPQQFIAGGAVFGQGEDVGDGPGPRVVDGNAHVPFTSSSALRATGCPAGGTRPAYGRS